MGSRIRCAVPLCSERRRVAISPEWGMAPGLQFDQNWFNALDDLGYKLRKLFISFFTSSAMLLANSVWSQVVVKTPIPADHPLVGSWRIDVPGTSCHEIYSLRADGSMRVTSGSQQAESEFELSVRPSPKGFYKWVDKIVKDNGKPDCMGEIMEVGHVATNYIRLHLSGTKFLMCEAEDINTCIGPFVREESV